MEVLTLIFNTSQVLEFGGVALIVCGLVYLGLLTRAELARLRQARRADEADHELFDWRLRASKLHFEIERDRAEHSWGGNRKFRVSQIVTENEVGDIRSFVLSPHDEKQLPPFRPGQFLRFELQVPGKSDAVVRCYSLSSYAREDGYRVSIKRVDDGVVSSHFHRQLQVGDILDVAAPAGDFYLDLTEMHPVVLIAGGIGVTPVLCMLEAALEHQPMREVTFFYGVRNRHEAIQTDRIQAMIARADNARAYLCYSAPGEDERALIESSAAATGRGLLHVPGRISVQPHQKPGGGAGFDITSVLPEHTARTHHFYLCGPPAMLESVTDDLRAWGVSDEQIHLEEFGPASLSATSHIVEAPGGEHVSVAFARSKVTVPWDPGKRTLYRLAIDNDVRVKSGCLAGNCGSCKTALISGKVSYIKQPSHPTERRSCLPCVAVPDGPVILDA